MVAEVDFWSIFVVSRPKVSSENLNFDFRNEQDVQNPTSSSNWRIQPIIGSDTRLWGRQRGLITNRNIESRRSRRSPNLLDDHQCRHWWRRGRKSSQRETRHKNHWEHSTAHRILHIKHGKSTRRSGAIPTGWYNPVSNTAEICGGYPNTCQRITICDVFAITSRIHNSCCYYCTAFAIVSSLANHRGIAKSASGKILKADTIKLTQSPTSLVFHYETKRLRMLTNLRKLWRLHASTRWQMDRACSRSQQPTTLADIRHHQYW